MVSVTPAVLAPSLEDIEATLRLLKGTASLVQIDIVDGVYARNRTWPYAGVPQQAEFEHMVVGEEKFPHRDDFEFQFDLMVVHPEREVLKYITLGARAITIHAASVGAGEAIVLLQPSRSDGSVTVGVALRAHDSPETLTPFEGHYDFVQVMGIEHEGIQGEPFDPDRKAVELIEELRKRSPSLLIQVDGGVRLENTRALVAAGAGRLVVGSAIVKAADPAAALEAFLREANT